jgi:hypothetical protein
VRAEEGRARHGSRIGHHIKEITVGGGLCHSKKCTEHFSYSFVIFFQGFSTRALESRNQFSKKKQTSAVFDTILEGFSSLPDGLGAGIPEGDSHLLVKPGEIENGVNYSGGGMGPYHSIRVFEFEPSGEGS